MTTIKVSNIKWDFSDTPKPHPNLPKNVTLEIDLTDEELADEQTVEHEINEKLANDYDFCNWGFSYIIVKPIKQQAGE